MVWSMETSQGNETGKIRPFVIPYTRGKGLDVGCGLEKLWPASIGVDNGHHFGGHTVADIRTEAPDLSMFASASLDYVYSSHVLEHIDDMKAALTEWWRVIRPGGHLVLYLPDEDLYPRVGQPGANPDHRHNLNLAGVEALVEAVAAEGGTGGMVLEAEQRAGGNEYSFFLVVQKVAEPSWQRYRFHRNPAGKPRALVIRYGGIGDIIWCASVLPGLKAQGYHVTVNTHGLGREVLEHDPNIDEWMLQDKDQVPNEALGEIWARLDERYDLIINLCESVEGSLLPTPGRVNHAYPDKIRRALYGKVNYVERTQEIAGVPHNPSAARFHPTQEELDAARMDLVGMPGDGTVVLAIGGSSHHKTYPALDVLAVWFLQHTPMHVVIMGGKEVAELQDRVVKAQVERMLGGSRDPKGRLYADRITYTCGDWPIRRSLAFIQCVDAIVGPETGLLNAVGMLPDVAKVVILSHSSADNLTRDWPMATAIVPDVPCYPCHRIHYGRQWCPTDPETKTAACAVSIQPKRIMDALVGLLAGRRKAA